MMNVEQRYEWGSPTMLPAIRRGDDLHVPAFADASPSTAPRIAELWMGSHPRGPSVLEDSGGAVPLPEHLVARPAATLGPAARALQAPGDSRPGLPFLFKILTAAKGLSIQAHPSRELAAEGYRREEAAGIDIAAPVRNYRDRNHKPELICALGEFWGLRGFRPPEELAAEMGALADRLPREARHLADRLRDLDPTGEDGTERWRAAFRGIMAAGADDTLRPIVVGAAADYAAQRTTASNRNDRYWWVGELLRQFPRDIGALAPLYLNLVHLQPGEAMFLTAGVLHAYLFGAGVEIMANSDNVLRAGCTVKHVDVPELERSLSFHGEHPQPVVPVVSECSGGTVLRYPTPAEEFELSRISGAGGVPSSVRIGKREGPAVVLAIGAPIVVSDGDATVELAPAESAFVDHETRSLTLRLSAGATGFLATIPGAVHCGG